MNELVYLKNDEAVCSSLLVAEKFEKRHADVIYINGEVNGYLKVAWDMSMTQYIMKNNKDGSVAQSWAKL